MIRWIKRLQSDVSSTMRSRGWRYFKAGAVAIKKGGPDRVEAFVTGGAIYSVVLQLEGTDDVAAFCSCPYSGGGIFCKHVWATLLAAEEDGYLHRIASRWNPRLVSATVPGKARDASKEQTAAPPPPKPKPTRPPQWKEHLSALRRMVEAPPPAPAAQRRIVYVVEVDDCLSSNGLIVKVAETPKKKNGAWGRPAFRHGSIRDAHSLDAADRRMLGLLAGSSTSAYSYPYTTESFATHHRVPVASADTVVPMLCATERFYAGSLRRPEELQLLRWEDGAPWEFRLAVREDESGGSYSMEGVLRKDSEERPLSAPLLLVAGLVFFPGIAARLDDKGAFSWIAFLRNTPRIVIPSAHREQLLAEMVQFPTLPPADLPAELRLEPRAFAGQPWLKVRPIQYAWTSQKMLECDIYFDYGFNVAEANTSGAVRDPETGNYFKRDREAEQQAVARLAAFGVRRDASWRHEGGWELPASRLPAIVRALVPEGWRIEAEGKLYRQAGSFRIDVTSGIDWFDLAGSADFDGQTAELPELLRALSRGDPMVALGDGSFGLLPEEWLKRYHYISGFGKAVDGRVRFTRHQASLLDALLAGEPEVTFDEGFHRIRRELETFAGVEPAAPSEKFKGSLRHYQQEGLGWLQFTRRFGLGACLADDMGLGKTIQVLALIDVVPRQGPVLVVVPRSLVFNWLQEAARFTPSLRVLDWSGVARKSQWSEIPRHDIVVTTYGTLRRDSAELKNIAFDTVVLDEAQSIKNASTESAKAARLLKASHRLALSGTPIENRLSDLWSLFEFLNPGLLGNGAVFRNQASEAPNEESSRILSLALRPFFLRRTKEKVAKELPAKTEQTIYCELDAPQRRLYNELRAHYRSALLGRIEEQGIEKSRMHILEALLRLRQAACHPGLIDKARVGESSAKLDSLLPQIQEVLEGGHKAVVFSQFTSLLAILKERLDAEKVPYEYLDGRTRNRDARVRRFQEDPTCPLFLISLKAGGLGLNLTAAEYVFLLDPWWNPAVEAQAIDRTHRIGQSRRVFAYRLIARDTVEEKVLDLQKSKLALADAIITADNSVLASLNRETLELLLS